MARIRTIKPEFWSDEKLSECSLSARLTFIGLWSFSDDAGRMEFNLARIRMQVYPCGTVSVEKLSEYIGELRERSLIRVYTIGGKDFLDIPRFAKHQKINRPTPSKLPACSVKTHEPLSDDSLPEGKGKGEEGKGKGTGDKNSEEGEGDANASTPKGSASRERSFVKNSLPSKTPSRDRRNDSFERINADVLTAVEQLGFTPHETGRIAQVLHISEAQARTSIQQLRDRGKLPLEAA